jgi:hypothetical protein
VDATFTLPLTNPVIPADTDTARHAWLEARIGADEVARFSWRFSTTQRPRVGQSDGHVTPADIAKRAQGAPNRGPVAP